MRYGTGYTQGWLLVCCRKGDIHTYSSFRKANSRRRRENTLGQLLHSNLGSSWCEVGVLAVALLCRLKKWISKQQSGVPSSLSLHHCSSCSQTDFYLSTSVITRVKKTQEWLAQQKFSCLVQNHQPAFFYALGQLMFTLCPHRSSVFVMWRWNICENFLFMLWTIKIQDILEQPYQPYFCY